MLDHPVVLNNHALGGRQQQVSEACACRLPTGRGGGGGGYLFEGWLCPETLRCEKHNSALLKFEFFFWRTCWCIRWKVNKWRLFIFISRESKWGTLQSAGNRRCAVPAEIHSIYTFFTSLSRIYLSRIVEKVPKNLSSYAPDQDEGNKQQCN